LVRNGHAPERHLQTGIGPIAVRRPRVRDRDENGSPPIRLTRPSCRPTCGGRETSRSCCPGSTSRASRPGSSRKRWRRSSDLMHPGCRPPPCGASPRPGRRSTRAGGGGISSTRRYVYLWADGVHFTPRLDHERQCLLVLIGTDASGRKELLAVEDGFRESAQSWRRAGASSAPPAGRERARARSGTRHRRRRLGLL
jgi:hypothetical protein